jgi:spermidine synthase
MGTLYHEKEGGITRIYKLVPPFLRIVLSPKALIEIPETEMFGTCLFIDGEMQLARADEYIYHEMLVHPLFCVVESRQKICVLGGGDGMAIREILKWDIVHKVDIVDWDTKIVEIFQTHYSDWNQSSLSNPRTHYIPQNVLDFLRESENQSYDAFIIDLFDPKLYTARDCLFWGEILESVSKKLASGGGIVLNMGSTSSDNMKNLKKLFDIIRNISWGEHKRLLFYRVYVPSFAAEWGFLLVLPSKTWHFLSRIEMIHKKLQYLDPNTWKLARMPRRGDPDFLVDACEN